jgi:hypothetical protein
MTIGARSNKLTVRYSDYVRVRNSPSIKSLPHTPHARPEAEIRKDLAQQLKQMFDRQNKQQGVNTEGGPRLLIAEQPVHTTSRLARILKGSRNAT